MAEHISEVMTAHPTALPASTSLAEAARAMRDGGIGDVVVLDEQDAVCGIVTDRDIVVRAVADYKDPREVLLGEICSRALITLSPDDNTKDAVKVMRQNALRRLPVTDNGSLVGIISLGDLAIERDPASTLADISAAPSNT